MKIIVESWLKGVPVLEHIKGYAGIERMTSTLTREFIKQGHEVTLIAPKGSFIEGLVDCVETNDFNAAYQYITSHPFDILWNNSCWSIDSPVRELKNGKFVSTTHVNHAIGWSKNVVYLSDAQRIQHGKQLNKDLSNSPVIRVPTDPNLIPRGLERSEYLLFIGSIVPYKGVLESAELANKLGRKLIVAGPDGGEYMDKVLAMHDIKYVGIVDGQQKNDLIEQAFAVCCLHNDGGIDWSEPGCGVIGEAAALNTPVAAFPNGCIPELITEWNGWIGNSVDELVIKIKYEKVRNPIWYGNTYWSVERIYGEYMELFEKVIKGYTWG